MNLGASFITKTFHTSFTTISEPLKTAHFIYGQFISLEEIMFFHACFKIPFYCSNKPNKSNGRLNHTSFTSQANQISAKVAQLDELSTQLTRLALHPKYEIGSFLSCPFFSRTLLKHKNKKLNSLNNKAEHKPKLNYYCTF